MKKPLLTAVAALIMGFAVPSIAEAQNTVAPEVGQQIEAVATQLLEAYNKHDAAAFVLDH